MTIDSMFYFVMIILGGGLTYAGFKTQIGLLNIASIPIWVFLAVKWSSEPLLMITMVALAFFQVIYIFKTVK